MRQKPLNFYKDRIYEIAYVSIIPGKEQYVFEGYLAKALDLVTQYGGQSMGTLESTNVSDCFKQPQIVAFFEWPSIDDWLQLHDDANFLKIRSIRDESVAFFNIGNFYTVDEDITVTVTNEKPYTLNNSDQARQGSFNKQITFDEPSDKKISLQEMVVFRTAHFSNSVKEKLISICGDSNDSDLNNIVGCYTSE